MSKGIVDPWRVVEPARPTMTPRPPDGRRVSLDEIDFDADLRAPSWFVFRGKHGCVEVRSRDIAISSDALKRLICCLFQLLERMDGPTLFERADIGFSLGDREWNVPPGHVPAAAVRAPGMALYFLRQPFEHGMSRLVQLLISAQRKPGKEGAGILKDWGVTPMLR